MRNHRTPFVATAALILAVTGCSKSSAPEAPRQASAADAPAAVAPSPTLAAPAEAAHDKGGASLGGGGVPGSGGAAYGAMTAPVVSAEPALSANARYATTYRPGRGHVAAFDAAVAHGTGGSAPPAGDAGSDASTSSGGSQVCCVIPNPEDDTATLKQGTGSFSCPVTLGAYGSRCKATCGPRDLQGCEADSECPTGKTCKLNSVGPQGRINMGTCL